MSRQTAWGLISGTLMLSGCLSREASSAGAVGCRPDDIEISDEEHHGGLVQTADTWVATCHGRTFVCSQINQSNEKSEGIAGLLATSTASEQVTCTEEAESPQAAQNRERRSIALAQRAATPKAPPAIAPAGAAGFELGMSAEAAQQRCEAAGNQWSASNPELASCSGAAAALGIPASVALRFCDARACSITIEHRPSTAWSKDVVSLKGKLEAKYGTAEAEGPSIPAKCRSDADFVRCLETRELELRYSWRWASGEAVQMLVGKPTASSTAAIRLVYTGSGSPVDASAL